MFGQGKEKTQDDDVQLREKAKFERAVHHSLDRSYVENISYLKHVSFNGSLGTRTSIVFGEENATIAPKPSSDTSQNNEEKRLKKSTSVESVQIENTTKIQVCTYFIHSKTFVFTRSAALVSSKQLPILI